MGGGGGKGQLRSSRLNNPVRQKSVCGVVFVFNFIFITFLSQKVPKN